MLKKISRLFLGLVVCASSACVTPTHASSAPMPPVLITKIQTASPISAKDELIELYNTTADTIDLSGWCLTNKALVKFACFDTKQKDNAVSHAILPAGTYATLVSNDFLVRNPTLTTNNVALAFAPSSQASGSLVASSDTLTLVDASDEVQDTWAWQAPAPSGKLLARQVLLATPLTYATTGSSSDWLLTGQSSAVRSGLQWIESSVAPESEVDPNEDNTNGTPHDGNTPSDPAQNQTGVVTPLQITELLPNAVGSDTGNEFIEVYNPNLVPITGEDYKLLVGASLDKTYTLPGSFIVAPLSYTVIKNDVIKFSLSNTAGAVQLSLKGVRVGMPIAYANPPEGKSWVIVAELWQYTNPTPGTANISLEIASEDTESTALNTTVVQKPCASNQYRNVATGRCRLIATTAPATRAPCKENQTRSLDTGRCRNNVTVAASMPCKAGQERSPETNRCRNITKMTNATNGLRVAEKSQKTSGATWYMWLGIGGVVLAIFSYAIWEWREEMQQLFQKIRKSVVRRPK